MTGAYFPGGQGCRPEHPGSVRHKEIKTEVSAWQVMWLGSDAEKGRGNVAFSSSVTPTAICR